jgi:hypothetical protein
MNNNYPHLQRYEKTIDSIVESKLTTKKPKTVAKGLLAKTKESISKDTMKEDYNTRIANYVMSIRNKRMGLKDVG